VPGAVVCAFDVLVATSLAFETTDGSILSAIGAAGLPAFFAPDRDTFFVTAVCVVLDVVAVVLVAEFIAVLTDFFAGAFSTSETLLVFAALARVATGVFLLAGDFTALLATVFFAGVTTALVAGLIALLKALTTLPVSDFAVVLTADLAVASLALLVAIGLGAAFFALFAAFVTVAFIVPCP